MITNRGKETILRYFAGIETQIAASLEVGIGTRAFAATDTRLQFPAFATNIQIVAVDINNSTVVFKGTLGESISGTFTELGLSYSALEASGGKNESVILTAGDPTIEAWVGPDGAEGTTNNVRIGDRGVSIGVNNNTQSATFLDFAYDLSEYSVLDQFSLAFHSTGDVDTFRVRFHVDGSNYFQFTSPVGDGYEIITFSKADCIAVGTPSWSDLVYMQIEASADGIGTLTFDALRVDDKDNVNQSDFLVARQVIAPFTKVAGQNLEVEYRMAITV